MILRTIPTKYHLEDPKSNRSYRFEQHFDMFERSRQYAG